MVVVVQAPSRFRRHNHPFSFHIERRAENVKRAIDPSNIVEFHALDDGTQQAQRVLRSNKQRAFPVAYVRRFVTVEWALHRWIGVRQQNAVLVASKNG
jgi:hypothetical protein